MYLQIIYTNTNVETNIKIIAHHFSIKYSKNNDI